MILDQKITLEDSIKSIFSSLNETQQYLIGIAEVNDITLTEAASIQDIDDILNEEMVIEPIEEGIIGKTIWYLIKECAKALLKFLVKVWNAIVGFVKKVITKILGFFGITIKGDAKLTTNFIVFEDANIKSQYIKANKLKDVYIASMNSISKEINKRAKTQIESVKLLNNIKSIKEYKILSGKEFTTYTSNGEYQGNLTSSDIISAIQQTDFSNYDAEKDKLLLLSSDLVKKYNEFISDFCEFCKNFKKDDPKYNFMHAHISNTIKILESTTSMTKDEINEFVAGSFFNVNQNTTEEEIRKIIQLRINYNKTIISMLKRMVLVNSAMLGLSKDEAKLLSNGLDKNEIKSFRAIMGKINTILPSLKRDGYIDYTELIHDIKKGDTRPHHVYYSDEIDDDISTNLATYDPEFSLMLALRWEMIVLSHGDNSTRYGQTSWDIAPIKVYGQRCTTIDQVIDVGILAGYRSIYIVSCNPDGADFEIPRYIRQKALKHKVRIMAGQKHSVSTATNFAKYTAVEKENNKNINDALGRFYSNESMALAAIGGIPSPNSSIYITQYGVPNGFHDDNVEGYTVSNDLISKNVLAMSDGKLRSEDTTSFLTGKKIKVFKYIGENVDQIYNKIFSKLNEEVSREFLYETVSGKKLLSDDQIECDPLFKEVKLDNILGNIKADLQTLVAEYKSELGVPLMNIPLMNNKEVQEANSLTEGTNVEIMESVNGYYAINRTTGRRTSCYRSMNEIPIDCVKEDNV